ncbi:hypothetical protein [Shewanella sp.]|uniref:hypothetical protein n=1 Tax=Shewanella sp. TaxID=50422 RepID=UPI003A97EF8B
MTPKVKVFLNETAQFEKLSHDSASFGSSSSSKILSFDDAKKQKRQDEAKRRVRAAAKNLGW